MATYQPWVPNLEASGPAARPVAGVPTAVCAAVIMRKLGTLFGGTYSSTFFTKHAVHKKYGKCTLTACLFYCLVVVISGDSYCAYVLPYWHAA